jgi:hypothetical protein
MKKPQAVTIAVMLYIASLFLGVGVMMLDYDYMVAQMQMPAAGLYVAMIVSILITLLLIWKISQGRNWARIVMLVLFVFGSYTAFTTTMQSFERSTLLGLLQTAQMLIQIAALVLIFIPPGSEYFKKPEEAEGAPSAN